MPVNLTNYRRHWPGSLKPLRIGEAEREPFEAWWARNQTRVVPLDPGVYEQWIYKHWSGSPFFGLPLAGLRSHRDILTTEFLLSQVGTADPDALTRQQAFDYEQFNSDVLRDCEPALTMNRTGTWNFPVLLIQSDDGFICYGNTFTSQSHWLIEGHLRMRYLAALAACGKPATQHEVIVVTYGTRRTRARIANFSHAAATPAPATLQRPA